MTLLWFIIAFVLFIVEFIVPSVAVIWFGVGALLSMFLSVLPVPVWLQVVSFMVVSTILFGFSTKKMSDDSNYNYDSIMDVKEGSKGVVVATIQAFGVGIVKIGNQEWSARGLGGLAVVQGDRIEVVKNGVILTVRGVEKEIKLDADY